MFADTVPQDEDVFRTQEVDRLMRDLSVALARKDSVAILAGASGTGKTTLALYACKTLTTRLAFSNINQPPQTAGELIEQVLTDFGIECAGMSLVERRQLWRQFVTEMAATDTRICLLVENVESIAADVLQSLHRLTAAEPALSPGANLVLTTTDSPEGILTAPELIALGQRVRLRRTVLPLDRAETQDYLAFKCRLSGADRDSVFASDVASVLHDYSGGVLRLTDAILESALFAAAAAGESQLTAARIRSIAESHFGASVLAADQVDALLDASTPADPAPARLEPSARAAAMAADDIPVLTDYLVRREQDGRFRDPELGDAPQPHWRQLVG